MKGNMIALYNENGNLIGYFHDETELNEYFDFLKRRGIETKGWKQNFCEIFV